jgi:hypothetical protein
MWNESNFSSSENLDLKINFVKKKQVSNTGSGEPLLCQTHTKMYQSNVCMSVYNLNQLVYDNSIFRPQFQEYCVDH